MQSTAKVVCSTRTSVPVSQGGGGQVGVARQCARLFSGGHGLRVLGGDCRWSSEGGRTRRKKDAQYQEKKNNGGLCRNFHGKGNLGRHGVTEAGMAAVGSNTGSKGGRPACVAGIECFSEYRESSHTVVRGRTVSSRVNASSIVASLGWACRRGRGIGSGSGVVSSRRRIGLLHVLLDRWL